MYKGGMTENFPPINNVIREENMKNEEAIKAIIKSPVVDQYLIGITSDSKKRKNSYKKEGFDCFAIIDTGLTKKDAISEEKRLFEMLTENKNEITYKKYHHEKREGNYQPSTGGKDDHENYDIYISWWNVD